MFKNFVAIGDSFTEGVGDYDPKFPNGVNGWADRAAAYISVENPEFQYSNLAIRGKKIQQIIDEQLELAISYKPELISFYAGANDIIRPNVDLNYVIERVEFIAKTLKTETNSKLLSFTAFDIPPSNFYSEFLRGRYAVFSNEVRRICDKYDIIVCDPWFYPEMRLKEYWCDDLIHPSTYGHTLISGMFLKTLGLIDEVPEHPLLGTERIFDTKLFKTLTPWVMRRFRGVSTGDDLKPKYEQLQCVLPDKDAILIKES